MRTAVRAGLLIAASAWLAHAQEPSPLRHTSAAWGFAIDRPSPDWLVSESEAGGAYTCTLTHRTSGKLVSARVIVRPAPGTRAADLRDKTISSVAGNPDYRVLRTYTAKLAGGDAPAMEVQQKSSGQWFHVRQAYRVADRRLYTVTCYAPAAGFARADPAFRRIWKSFALLAPDPLSEQGLRRTAARCGSDFTWETEWPAAAKRAAAEHKLVFVAISSQSGFQLSDRIRTSILMDQDVAALVRQRFVLLAYRGGIEAPWTRQGGSYGISARGFGTTMLIVTPEGEYAGDLQAVAPPLADRFLRGVLRRHPKAVGQPKFVGADGADALAAAEEALARGELDRALAIAGVGGSVGARRVRAAVARRRFDATTALEELRTAREGAAPEALPGLQLDEALVRLRTADWEAAEALAQAVLDGPPAHPRRPEALYYYAYARIRRKALPEATAAWRRLVREHPESPWAWKAAELLVSPYLGLGTAPRIRWSDPEVRGLLRRLEREGPEQTESTERDAVAYLVKAQRDDGSWVSPTETTSVGTNHYGALTVAKTAVCTTSLLAYRADPAVQRAIERGLGFLLRYRAWLAATPPTPPLFMDYRPWTRAYELSCYVESAVAGVGERDALQSAMAATLADLHAMQKPGGGWSYYVSTDPAQRQPQNQSISFVTAACLHAVLDAKAYGAELPKGMLARGLSCLERMRHPTGHFEYFLWHDRPAPAPATALDLGALGRGPVCMLALHRAGRATVEDVQGAVTAFLRHRNRYAREQGKSLMHAGPEGQGCHYLLFDYLYTARAVRRLPEAGRPALRRALAQLIHAARYTGGGYADTPLIGRHGGTGLALLAVRALVPERK